MNSELKKKLDDVLSRYEWLEQQLALPEVAANQAQVSKLAKEHSHLTKLVGLIRSLNGKLQALADAELMLTDDTAKDLHPLAKQEIGDVKPKLERLEHEIVVELTPKDASDVADAVLEIRAGTGGEEAALFAAELRRMYIRYAEAKSWKIMPIHEVATGIGGVKEAVFEIAGEESYKRLKMESGVHRVQRVPDTESSGRLHTSAATVAVLPKAEENDISINDGDLKVDIFHAGGHGGQNVNKVATAVRITHKPSGIVVVCQNERSQLQNKIIAMSVLRTRLWDAERQKKREEQDRERRSQVGGGDRSEKIRTYNFPQSRVTDHRVKFTTARLQEVLNGELDEMTDVLLAAEQARLMSEAKV